MSGPTRATKASPFRTLKPDSSKQSPPRPAPAASSLSAVAFVWGAWVLTILTALALIWKYDTSVPMGDDWGHWMPFVTGDTPFTLPNLWAQEGEHRIFLERVIGTVLLRLSNGHYWSLNLFAVAALGGLAAAMIRAAKCQRGLTSYADAFFPLALLHWMFSHCLNFGNPFYTYGLSAVVAGFILVVIVRRGAVLTPWSALAAGGCLALLPLCGAAGMLYVPPLALWLGVCAVATWRSPEPRGKRSALTLAVALALTGALIGLYFKGYQKGGGAVAAESPNWNATLETSLAFLTQGLGYVAQSLWPYSGRPLLALVGLSLTVVGAVVWRQRGLNRGRAVGLLFFAGALAILVGLLGWGRASLGTSYAFTYPFLPALVLPWLYFAWGTFRPRTVGYGLQMCLFTLTCLLLPLNAQHGMRTLEEHAKGVKALEADLRNGVPTYLLVARYHNVLAASPDELNVVIENLGRARIGVFRYLQRNPKFREVPLSVAPSEAHEIQWDGDVARGTDTNSYLTFALPEPMLLAGVRLRCNLGNPDDKTVITQVAWKGADEPDFKPPRYAIFPQGDNTLFIGEPVAQIRVYPDFHPFAIQIQELVAIVPEPE